MQVTKDNFLELIKKIAQSDTSADPANWTKENPLWGHCAVAALVAQDYFGGTLVRGSLKVKQKYVHLRSHFWNKLPDGTEVDFTAEQYSDVSFRDLVGEERTRERVLEHPDTMQRYTLLKIRFESV